MYMDSIMTIELSLITAQKVHFLVVMLSILAGGFSMEGSVK